MQTRVPPDASLLLPGKNMPCLEFSDHLPERDLFAAAVSRIQLP
jgi:hypothetical protein